MSGGENDLNVEPMLFMQIVVDDQVSIAEMIGRTSDWPMVMTGVADIAWSKAAQAQADLDEMIEADDTWRPCYGTDCEMVYEDTDPEVGDILRCTVHNYTVIADAYVCEGYTAPPYTGGH